MNRLFTLLALVCVLSVSVQAAHYAVLVAGSNYFYNYRHQADVFHAYSILSGYGIPADNIITMAYDDIANDPENPFPGKVYNKPSTGPGKDVYAGIVIDYKGADVTPTNFLKVITGDTTATGKVLKSTENDNVFIFFADHGATGLIAFPNEYLYANDFIAALKKMNTSKLYSELVIYIEACESGSMFSGILPKNIKIYATTAANPSESSWATYCSPLDMVNGTEVGSCLGDLYSVNFLENLESVNPASETLAKQFDVVQKETNLSHVMKYGNETISQEEIANFEANGQSVAALLAEVDEVAIAGKKASVSSRMVKLAYLQRKHEKANSAESRLALQEEMDSIARLDTIFNTMRAKFNLKVTQANTDNIKFDCLKNRVAIYEDVCGKLSDYGLKYVRYISETCNDNVSVYDFEDVLFRQCF